MEGAYTTADVSGCIYLPLYQDVNLMENGGFFKQVPKQFRLCMGFEVYSGLVMQVRHLPSARDIYR